jgi:hypothetical protein
MVHGQYSSLLPEVVTLRRLNGASSRLESDTQVLSRPLTGVKGQLCAFGARLALKAAKRLISLRLDRF